MYKCRKYLNMDMYVKRKLSAFLYVKCTIFYEIIFFFLYYQSASAYHENTKKKVFLNLNIKILLTQLHILHKNKTLQKAYRIEQNMYNFDGISA